MATQATTEASVGLRILHVQTAVLGLLSALTYDLRGTWFQALAIVGIIGWLGFGVYTLFTVGYQADGAETCPPFAEF